LSNVVSSGPKLRAKSRWLSSSNCCVGEDQHGVLVKAAQSRILHPMRDILFDEKIALVSFTPGQAYEEADNGNRSQVHWDMVSIQRPDYGGGEIYFDGKLIRKNGVFPSETTAFANWR